MLITMKTKIVINFHKLVRNKTKDYSGGIDAIFGIC